MKFEKFYYLLSLSLVVGSFLTLATIEGRDNAVEASKVHVVAQVYTPMSNKVLVFDDEFNGNALDASKWSMCYDWRKPSETGCTNQGNFEKEWYTRDQVTVADGTLTLTAKKEPIDVAVQNQVKTFQYQSGMINSGSGSTASRVRWSGTYGYYEARLKFGKGQGIWPAFWLLPVDKEWPPEIDAMEFLGGEPSKILQTVHWQDNSTPKFSTQTIIGKDYSDAWHTYGVDWEPDRIDWYIDGVKTRSYTGANVPNQPMEVIIDLAVGGTLPKDPNSTTAFPQELQVDYVHVYQTKDQIRPSQY